MTLLITGGSGTLGQGLAVLLPGAWKPSRRELDMTDPASVRAYLRAHTPTEIVHAAALTDLPRCEEDQERAWETNVEGTETLLRLSRDLAPDSFFLYVSTAGVFRGDAGPYDEGSRPDPVNFYGVTKLEGERQVKRYPGTCIARTNFVKRGPWPHPFAFTDRFGSFLYETGAAKGIRDVLAARVTGIVHVCGDTRLSLYDLARRIDPSVKPITMDSYRGIPLTKDMSLVTRRWHPYTLDD